MGTAKIALKPQIQKTFTELKSMTKEEHDAWREKNAEIEAHNIAEIKRVSQENENFMLEAEKSIEDLNNSLKEQGLVLEEKIKSNGTVEKNPFAKELKEAFDQEIEKAKNFKQSTEISLEISAKATQTYGDIDSGSDFAQMRQGVTDIPTRKTGIIRSLFNSIPVNTEFYKYTYQQTVTRDAQNVAICGSLTSNTKETLKTDTIQTKKIKDIMKFCREFVDDYPFMESRIRKLLSESVALRVDQQILLGTNTGEETDSINRVSSEFSATNVVCPVDASIKDATMVDLILAMAVQIEELGQQNFFMADTVLVNRCDWFTKVESRKDADGNYIDSRVSYINGVPFIGGMMVIASPLVDAGTLYVFDSSKGEIVSRKGINVEIATENSTDWENEIASIKAYLRLNFLVINNNENAFMKCSDVDLAISAINKA